MASHPCPLRFPASRSSFRVSTRRATSWAPSTTRWPRASATPRPERSSSSTTAPPTARARWPRRWSSATRACVWSCTAPTAGTAPRCAPGSRPRACPGCCSPTPTCQFDLDELGGFVPLADRADIVVGYRRRRQDPVGRRLNARCWNWLVRRVFRARRPRRRLRLQARPHATCSTASSSSDGAMISTELLVKARLAGAPWPRPGSTTGGARTGAERRQPARGDPRAPRARPPARLARADVVESAGLSLPAARPTVARRGAGRRVGAAPAVLIVAVAAALRLAHLGAVPDNPFYDAAVRSMGAVVAQLLLRRLRAGRRGWRWTSRRWTCGSRWRA